MCHISATKPCKLITAKFFCKTMEDESIKLSLAIWSHVYKSQCNELYNYARPNLMLIGHSLYYSSDQKNTGWEFREKGINEFTTPIHINMNGQKQVDSLSHLIVYGYINQNRFSINFAIPDVLYLLCLMYYYEKHKDYKVVHRYPADINPQDHTACLFGKNIYIITDGDHNNTEIIEFNTINKVYTKKVENMPKLGNYPNAVVIGEYIHIFNGSLNHRCHLVYHPLTNRITQYTLPSDNKMYGASTVVYRNRIIQFGGWSFLQDNLTRRLLISSVISHKNQCPQWQRPKQWNYPCRVWFNGAIRFKHYVISFGGESLSKLKDEIFVLDLTDDQNGWVQLQNLKCPSRSRYLAIMGENDIVYLFGGRECFTMPVTSLMNDFMNSK